jgi:ATP-binding cassette subfamily B (MDR/TAP) protein 1
MKRGSILLLYSTLTRRDVLFLVPAIVLALASGVIPALMAKIIGSTFDGFTSLNPTNLPIAQVPQERKDSLRHTTTQAVWQLCLLGGATTALSTVMISMWIMIGEKVTRGWRLRIYKGLGTKDMKWYDTDLRDKAGVSEGSGSVGAGGIMAKFAR